MALRLIEVFLPEDEVGKVAELLADPPPLGLWRMSVADGQSAVRILVDAERSDAVLDGLESRCKHLDGFRVILLHVEAAIPRPAEPAEVPAEPVRAPAETAPAAAPARISPEELYADIADTSRLSGVYLAMVVLASIVAAIGLVRSNVAVVVGASGDGALAGTARSAGRSDLSRSADVNRGDVNAVPYPAGRAASRARRTEPLRTCRSRCGKGMVTPCRRQASSMAKFRSLLNLMGL